MIDLIRNQLNIKQNDFLVGNIGRFVGQKNQIYLINIFKEFLKLNLTEYVQKIIDISDFLGYKLY